jgi:hypothetical protein
VLRKRLRLQEVRALQVAWRGEVLRRKIFKEPEGSRRAWVFLLIACYFFVETVFFREDLSERLAYLAFGVAVLGFGLAEFVPRDRTGLAGTLRMCSAGLMVVILAVRAVQLITFAG